MRHNKKHGLKLGTDASHTKAMKRSLVSALLYNDRIKTTEPRAKEIRADVDRIITWAKKGDLHSRRLAIAWLCTEPVAKKAEKAAPKKVQPKKVEAEEVKAEAETEEVAEAVEELAAEVEAEATEEKKAE